MFIDITIDPIIIRKFVLMFMPSFVNDGAAWLRLTSMGNYVYGLWCLLFLVGLP